MDIVNSGPDIKSSPLDFLNGPTKIESYVREHPLKVRNGRTRYTVKYSTHESERGELFPGKALYPGKNQDVMIKTLPKNLMFNNPDADHHIEEFVKGAEALVKLDGHPHIMTLLDFDYAEFPGDPKGGKQRPFISMQMYDRSRARTLKERLKHRDPLTLREGVVFVEEMGSALDFAHSKGVIHNDITPANVIQDKERDWLLTDFGIASGVIKPIKNMTAGTPGYMSPENMKEIEKADDSSDLYSLGVVLYEGITGELPYELQDTPEANMVHIYDNQTKYKTAPLEKFGLKSHLVKFFDKALSKQKDGRFKSGKEMADAFKKAVESIEIYNRINSIDQKFEKSHYEEPPDEEKDINIPTTSN